MTETSETVALAADIVAAFVSNNSVAATELPSMIQSVYRALTEAASGVKPQEAAPPLTPAVPIKKSVTPDYIISLED
jgi:predicted transcriptional regulator